jgi:hypothetical protein
MASQDSQENRMSSNFDNFKACYIQVLEGLYNSRDAGIAVLMISLPLLERYLRRKHNLASKDDMTDVAMGGLCAMFPALGAVAQARAFWNVYRNGFLHQATVSRSTKSGASLPGGWLTHDIAEPIRLETDGTFTVNPVLFSKMVLGTISGDFGVFEADAPPLPQVARRDPITIPSTYVGTGNG